MKHGHRARVAIHAIDLAFAQWQSVRTHDRAAPPFIRLANIDQPGGTLRDHAANLSRVELNHSRLWAGLLGGLIGGIHGILLDPSRQASANGFPPFKEIGNFADCRGL